MNSSWIFFSFCNFWRKLHEQNPLVKDYENDYRRQYSRRSDFGKFMKKTGEKQRTRREKKMMLLSRTEEADDSRRDHSE